MLAAAWFDLPAHTHYGSIKQVRSASTSHLASNWTRRNAYIRGAHQVNARVASCLVSPVNLLLVISRHTVLNWYFCLEVRPLLDYIRPQPCGSSACVPTEPSHKAVCMSKFQRSHFAIRQLTLRIPSHPPASCVAMTPHDLQNCLLRSRMSLSSWTHLEVRLPLILDPPWAKRG